MPYNMPGGSYNSGYGAGYNSNGTVKSSSGVGAGASASGGVSSSPKSSGVGGTASGSVGTKSSTSNTSGSGGFSRSGGNGSGTSTSWGGGGFGSLGANVSRGSNFGASAQSNALGGGGGFTGRPGGTMASAGVGIGGNAGVTSMGLSNQVSARPGGTMAGYGSAGGMHDAAMGGMLRGMFNGSGTETAWGGQPSGDTAAPQRGNPYSPRTDIAANFINASMLGGIQNSLANAQMQAGMIGNAPAWSTGAGSVPTAMRQFNPTNGPIGPVGPSMAQGSPVAASNPLGNPVPNNPSWARSGLASLASGLGGMFGGFGSGAPADPRRNQSAFQDPTTPYSSTVQMQQIGSPAYNQMMAQRGIRPGPVNPLGANGGMGWGAMPGDVPITNDDAMQKDQSRVPGSVPGIQYNPPVQGGSSVVSQNVAPGVTPSNMFTNPAARMAAALQRYNGTAPGPVVAAGGDEINYPAPSQGPGDAVTDFVSPSQEGDYPPDVAPSQEQARVAGLLAQLSGWDRMGGLENDERARPVKEAEERAKEAAEAEKDKDSDKKPSKRDRRAKRWKYPTFLRTPYVEIF